MAKKLSDAQCLENYAALCSLFADVVEDSDRFEVVYGYGMDVGLRNFVVVRQSVTTYCNYAIGYDVKENEIVLLPVDVDLSAHGEPYYMKNSEIKKAKMGMLNKEITIYDNRLKKKYIQFLVPELINQDPDDVCICVKQNEQAKRFTEFFKQQYKK